MQQVSVRGVQLDHRETGAVRAVGGLGEGAHDARDSGLVERLRHLVLLAETNRARRDDAEPALLRRHRAAALPGTRSGSLPPGVGELDAHLGALRPHERGDLRELACLLLLPDAEILRADRPSGVTAAASVNTSEAPPTARDPRWTRCQSVANPSSDEY